MTTATAQYTETYFEQRFQGCFSPDDIKKQYRQLAKEFHPDLHPELGQIPFQVLGKVYERLLRGQSGRSYQEYNQQTKQSQEKTYTYDQSYEAFLKDVIDFACKLNCKVELVGSWLWIQGTKESTKPLQFPGEGKPDDRKKWRSLTGEDILFKWSKTRGMWYLALTDYYGSTGRKKRGSGRSMDEIRTQYGSRTLKTAV